MKIEAFFLQINIVKLFDSVNVSIYTSCDHQFVAQDVQVSK